MPTIDVPNIAANTPLWLALVTTFVAAVSGAILGRQPSRVHYDIVGVTVFAFVMGLGGGLTRDIFL
ncbi:MAG: TRIC cation channel family protein, partial [Candidatus Nanopelagicales bacterium]